MKEALKLIIDFASKTLPKEEVDNLINKIMDHAKTYASDKLIEAAQRILSEVYVS